MHAKKKNRPDNFCLSISNLEDTNGNKLSNNTIFDEFDECRGAPLPTEDENIEYLFNPDDERQIECSMFDSSDNMIENSFEKKIKPDDLKGNILSNVNQKLMCENYKEDGVNSKCEFIEYQKPMPGAQKTRYDKMTVYPKDQ